MAALIYWPGLTGPFLLDDYSILTPVSRWHSGMQTWQLTVLPNPDSVLDSRPVAMLSFMLSAWLGDGSIFSLKLGNLLIHLCCGTLGFLLLRRILRSVETTAAYANGCAAILAIIWLIHPLQVSTVLYMVQRMAQLAALFTLTTLLLYLIARQQLEQGRIRSSLALLFLILPCLITIGALSKQNAILAPVLCLVLELAYLSKSGRMPVPIRWFHGVFVLLPAVAAIAALIVIPTKFLGGYTAWDFTLHDRLLTQPRVLLDYVRLWFVPYSPGMGLYSDDFPISTSLISPWTTIPSIVLLLTICVGAVRLRTRAPHVFAGWFFFLVAHGVESTILPIEMHYEHRNYLPSFGLLLVAVGLVTLWLQGRRDSAPLPRRIRVLAATSVLAILTFATFGRVLVWQTEIGILTQAVAQHPDSLRAHVDLSAVWIREKRYDMAAKTMQNLAGSASNRNRFIARMDLLTIGCMSGVTPHVDVLEDAVSTSPRKITVSEVHVALLQQAALRDRRCATSAAGPMARSMVRLLDRSMGQAESVPTKMVVRRVAAELYEMAGQSALAVHQAEIGWNARKTMPMGSLLASLYLQSGQIDAAANIISSMKKMTRPFDNLWLADIARLETQLQAARHPQGRGAPAVPGS